MLLANAKGVFIIMQQCSRLSSMLLFMSRYNVLMYKGHVESCRQLRSGTVKCDIGMTHPSMTIIVLSILVNGLQIVFSAQNNTRF